MLILINFIAKCTGRKLCLHEFLKNDSRIIEVDMSDSSTLDHLGTKGFLNCLGLQRNFRKRSPVVGSNTPYIAPMVSRKQIYSNSTDVLILSGRSMRYLPFYGMYNQSGYVLWTPAFSLDSLLGVVGVFINIVLKNAGLLGFTVLSDSNFTRQFMVIKIFEKKKLRARRYISPEMGIEDFFKNLKERGAVYTLLRWFEDLPDWKPGEDIDLLVGDDDVPVVEELLRAKPGLIPCDIYSVSGLHGTSYMNMAYFKPLLAKHLLENRKDFKEFYYVPDKKNLFFSLAYHAVYHKGEKSGIHNSYFTEEVATADHDYPAILCRTAKEAAIRVDDITLESLHELLSEKGYSPPTDTLGVLASRNRWLRMYLQDLHKKDLDSSGLKGLATFFIREEAFKQGFYPDVLTILNRIGFHVLEEKELSDDEKKIVKDKARGGNWGKGPWKKSGGDPVKIIVAFDLVPKKPSIATRRDYPLVDNERVVIAKKKIRESLNDKLPVGQRCNMLHSSDNAQMAWEYLSYVFDCELSGIREKIKNFKDFTGKFESSKSNLTRHGRRARLEFTEYKGRQAVKKVFRPGCERFLEREIFVMKNYSCKIPEIPDLLGYGEDYFITPFYEDIRKLNDIILPLPVIQRCLEICRFFYNEGYAIIDFNPSNIIICSKDLNFKIIDFEFLYKYPVKPASFEESYDIAGVPEDIHMDRPVGRGYSSIYESYWQPLAGLDFESMSTQSMMCKKLKRFFYFLPRLPFRIVNRKIKKATSALEKLSKK